MYKYNKNKNKIINFILDRERLQEMGEFYYFDITLTVEYSTGFFKQVESFTVKEFSYFQHVQNMPLCRYEIWTVSVERIFLLLTKRAFDTCAKYATIHIATLFLFRLFIVCV